MTERATVTQGVQLGVESTPGDGAAADILVNSFTISPGPKVDMQRFRPTGQKLDSIIVVGKEWTECKVSGIASYTELQYLFAGVFGPNQVTQPSPDGAAELWKWKLAARDVDEVQTYSFEQGDSNFAHKFGYGLLTDLNLSFSRAGAMVDGTLIAHRISTGATLTADPVSAPEVPVVANEIDVYLNDTFGSLGTTKLTRCMKADLKIGNKQGAVWTLNSAENSFTSHVELAPKLDLELTLDADDQGLDLFDTLRAGDTVYVRIEATSPQLAAVGKNYQLKIDGAYKVSAVSDFSDEDGVYAIKWTLSAVYDSAHDLAVEATLRNAEIALSPPLT